MPQSPTQRVLNDMRRMGWTVCVVEKWLPIPPRKGADGDDGNGGPKRVRKDAFGFGDLLACRSGDGVALVQATSRSNRSSRRNKINESDEARTWLQAGGRIIVATTDAAVRGRKGIDYEEVTNEKE